MADNWPMESGGVGETIGVALVAVGLFVGWRYGPRAQKKYEWIFGRVALVSLAGVLMLLLGYVIWWAITG